MPVRVATAAVDSAQEDPSSRKACTFLAFSYRPTHVTARHIVIYLVHIPRSENRTYRMFTSEWLQLQVENTKTSADFRTTARDFLGLLQFSISRNSAIIAAYQNRVGALWLMH